MSTDQKIVVCGGGGFIGGHLVGDLLSKGFKNVRCVDIKPIDEWYQVHRRGRERRRRPRTSTTMPAKRVKGRDVVYNLACNMGGMGFIENNKGLCMISVLINTHLLHGRHASTASKRFFYASIRLRLQRRQAEGQERSTSS